MTAQWHSRPGLLRCYLARCGYWPGLLKLPLHWTERCGRRPNGRRKHSDDTLHFRQQLEDACDDS
jgi:hypothetical protein